MKQLYKTTVVTKGGRAGQAKSDDGHLDIKLALPKDLGGEGDGTNPEQLFAAGLGACFEMALRHTAKAKNKEVTDSSITADVSLNSLDDGSFGLAVKLTVNLEGLNKEEAKELVEATKQVCPYSKAIQGNVDLQIDVV